ncbi:TnsA-like heteromeric transposase endonuclease subunit [Nonomuraea basaltis]|uniref:TnsA-like heteromeric transposase endonuclease subunit n=1 Tax=Nonomuraea basaltis TaxID=2495887 RepID=UPI00110C64DB|nr:TnsA-like heteromeric transposase endonuclease subunit [Nonomuraea basaltis]TMR88564.1 TnsA-like heteromeric transposase endonuclease subunit [Nonomuraea basaltis]
MVIWVSVELAYAGVARSQFEVSYVDLHGTQVSGPLNACWDALFEDALPVRSFPSFKGQRNFPGWWWSATSGRHVGHESWLEHDHAMLLDFDPEVVGFSSQPLAWQQEAKRREHVPDYFARQADGTGVVIDVRADERIEAVAAGLADTGNDCGGQVRPGEAIPTLAQPESYGAQAAYRPTKASA